jgi:hypothetical protein
MVKATHQHKVFLDARGALEIEGLTQGSTEAHRLQEALGIGELKPLDFLCSAVRADGLDDGARNRVRSYAREQGWVVEEREDLGDPPKPKIESGPHESTVDVIHMHTLQPTRREKLVIPLMVLAVAVVLAGVGMVVYDHMNHQYTPVRGPAGALAAARNLPGPTTGLAGFFNPDDKGYVSVRIRSWQAWAGTAAITDGHLLYFEALPVSVEDLVKGTRGSASIVLQMDLRAEEPPRFHVDTIVRAGMATEYGNMRVEIYPMEAGTAPDAGGQADSPYRSDNRLSSEDRFPLGGTSHLVAVGYLERADDGFLLQARGYNLALGGSGDTAFARILDGLTMTEEEAGGLAEAFRPKSKLSLPSGKLVAVYAEIETAYPPDHPARAEGTIGIAAIRGVRLARAYIPNPS